MFQGYGDFYTKIMIWPHVNLSNGPFFSLYGGCLVNQLNVNPYYLAS